MRITSLAIVNGIIQDRYGKRGCEFRNKNGEIKDEFHDGYMPTRSIPIQISEAPENTISFCIFIEDKDAIPVCGFPWIHWAVANLTRNEIEENESINAKGFIQGMNSWGGAIYNFDKEAAIGYGGMTPPDKEHIYHINVYAVDTKLEIQNGFFVNELFKAMEGHVLEVETISAIYFN
jgi:Raf kinase inhibitor-like YbhB/YbcL family protein